MINLEMHVPTGLAKTLLQCRQGMRIMTAFDKSRDACTDWACETHSYTCRHGMRIIENTKHVVGVFTLDLGCS